MQTISGHYNAAGTGGQVFSWIDDHAARVAAPGLHGRNILSDLDLSRADVDAWAARSLRTPAGSRPVVDLSQSARLECSESMWPSNALAQPRAHHPSTVE